MKKRGFTLIELMVVIVIIGILAAIAIPKLFGMTAKAKASEVGPAVGTWSKLEQAYKMETGSMGNWASVGYKAPGQDPTDKTKGSTTNFDYSDPTSSDQTAQWQATAKNLSSDCKSGVWSANFAVADESPTASVPASATGNEGCGALTPNFSRIQ